MPVQSGAGRRCAAAAVAADGVGHLAPAPLALIGVAVLLGGLAAFVWLVGLQLHHAYAAASACHPAGSPVCSVLASSFHSMDVQLSNGFLLAAGARADRGVPRRAAARARAGERHLPLRLDTGLRASALDARQAGAARDRRGSPPQPSAFCCLGTTSRTLRRATRTNSLPRFPALLRPVRPAWVAFAAWTLTAFAVGALAGVLIRRVVPAIVATLVVYAGLALRPRRSCASTT